jgi:GDP-L-fucose synthase
MYKIFLTGANGLVGSNIRENSPLKMKLICPEIQELDLLDVNAVDRFLTKEKPNFIIHAAGIVGGIQANISNPVKFLTLNTIMANNLILSARNHQVKYFINLGSSCMYPRNAPNPLTESMVLKGELEPTNEGYAIAKIYAQRLCSYINREDGNTNYKTIIPCNLYGRWDKFDPQWSHMIPAVIRKIYEAKINNSPHVEIWGDGQARREFMYAGDLANFIWYAVQNIDSIPELVNLGMGHDHTINEYYQAIADVIGFEGTFKHDLTKPVGMKQKLVDTTLLNTLEWCPKHSLKEGIEKTYQFFIDKYF